MRPVEVAVRAWPDAEVRQAAPVGQIVSALPALLRPVRYLVLSQPCGGEYGLAKGVHLGCEVGVRLRRGAEAHVGLQWRAWFQRERVGGEVVRPQGDGSFERVLPR